MLLDELADFNEIIEYYRATLDVLPYVKPLEYLDKTNPYVQKMLDPKMYKPSFKAVCNNESLALFRYLEKNEIEDYSLFGIEKICQNIVATQNISEFEKLRQVRNCLAHAEYTLVFDKDFDTEKMNDNKLFLYLNNGKVSGTIAYSDFYQYVDDIYARPFEKEAVTYYVRLIDNQNNTDTLNRAKLKRFLDRVQINGKPLDEKTKEFCKQYFEYIHYEKFNQADPAIKDNILKNILSIIPSNSTAKTIGGKCTSTMFMQQLQNIEQKDSDEKIMLFSKELVWKTGYKVSSFQAPFICSDTLLGLCNYLLVYVRELNKNSDTPIFKYANLELLSIPNNIKAKYIKSKNTMQDKIDYRDQLRKELYGTRKQKSILTSIEEKIIYNNTNNKNPKRSTLLVDAKNSIDSNTISSNILSILLNKTYTFCKDSNYNFTREFVDQTIDKLLNNEYVEDDLSSDEKAIKLAYLGIIKNYKNKQNNEYNIDELSPEILSLNDELKSNITYQDSSELFRYLRNSIAHGRVQIDYTNCFKKNDFSKINFHFEDYDKDKKTGKEIKVFELDISAKDLLIMLDELQSKISTSLEEASRAEELKKLNALSQELSSKKKEESKLSILLSKAKLLYSQFLNVFKKENNNDSFEK